MSLKTLFNCIKYTLSQYKQNNQKEPKLIHFEEKLREIRFTDISASFPEKYFLIDFEPLYSFFRIIKGRNIALLSTYCSRDLYLSNLLDNLFLEKEVGTKQLFFSDFCGVVNSKETEHLLFEDFKNQQYERTNSDSYYKDYESLRYEVFNTDRTGNTNAIKDAIVLHWSKSIFADNRDRSHRFASLCKWNEVEKRNDSEIFNVRELYINTEKQKEFLDNYFGFIISAKTASEIFNVYANNSFINWQMYCSFSKSGFGELICLIIYKIPENQNIIDIFMHANNCVNINKFLQISDFIAKETNSTYNSFYFRNF